MQHCDVTVDSRSNVLLPRTMDGTSGNVASNMTSVSSKSYEDFFDPGCSEKNDGGYSDDFYSDDDEIIYKDFSQTELNKLSEEAEAEMLFQEEMATMLNDELALEANIKEIESLNEALSQKASEDSGIMLDEANGKDEQKQMEAATKEEFTQKASEESDVMLDEAYGKGERKEMATTPEIQKKEMESLKAEVIRAEARKVFTVKLENKTYDDRRKEMETMANEGLSPEVGAVARWNFNNDEQKETEEMKKERLFLEVCAVASTNYGNEEQEQMNVTPKEGLSSEADQKNDYIGEKNRYVYEFNKTPPELSIKTVVASPYASPSVPAVSLATSDTLATSRPFSAPATNLARGTGAKRAVDHIIDSTGGSIISFPGGSVHSMRQTQTPSRTDSLITVLSFEDQAAPMKDVKLNESAAEDNLARTTKKRGIFSRLGVQLRRFGRFIGSKTKKLSCLND